MSKSYQHLDPLMFKAKYQGFRARSVFKLQELDLRFNLLHPGQKVLDLGASPGSWLQYCSQKMGNTGEVIGLDLLPIKKVAQNVTTYICDIFNQDQVNQILQNTKFELILADLAPNTSGIPGVDHHKSLELDLEVFKISQAFLKPGGDLVMKIFDGEKLKNFLDLLKKAFQKVTAVKVKASRETSKELYIICLKKL